jgi:hypothetical protein
MLQFKAYDNVNQKWYFSKDYKSLEDFFFYHDNVQFTIILLSSGDEVVKLLKQ